MGLASSAWCCLGLTRWTVLVIAPHAAFSVKNGCVRTGANPTFSCRPALLRLARRRLPSEYTCEIWTGGASLELASKH